MLIIFIFSDNATKKWRTVKTSVLDEELIDFTNKCIAKLKTNSRWSLPIRRLRGIR